MLFETISHAVKDILVLMDNKIQNREREPLTKEDHFLLSELASVGAGICTSVNSFQWSDIIDSKYIERTSQMIKSVQEQAAAYLLEQLIPTDYVKFYVEMLFYDMTASERMVQASYKRDEKEMQYMDEARDFIGNILGTYIAISEKSKYRVLEYCKIGEIFFLKIFNPTYMQELLNRSSTINFGLELVRLMKRKYLEYKIDGNQLERVVGIAWGDYWQLGSNSKKKMLILVTSTSIYLLNPCTAPPCPLCGEERFCPAPPTFNTRIDFPDVTKIVHIPEFAQFVCVQYGGDKVWGSGTTFIFVTKSYSGGRNLAKTLADCKAEMFKSKIEEGYLDDTDEKDDKFIQADKCFTDSLENSLLRDEKGSIKMMTYASYNPKDRLPFAGPIVFPNGSLCVLTDKNMIVVVEINFKHWEFFNPENNKVSDEEESSVVVPTSLVKQDLFSITKAIDIGKCTDAKIPKSSECKFVFEVETKHTFLFGDDLALEAFQRNVMREVYKLRGGKKIKKGNIKDTKAKGKRK